MSRMARIAVLLLAALALGWAGWRILSLQIADQRVHADPEAALRWRPDHPAALLARVRAGSDPEASATLQHLLQREPLQGEAWQLLAAIQEAAGDKQEARRLYQQAVDVAPRTYAARNWLAREDLLAGDYPAGLQHVDAMLRLTSALGPQLHELLVHMSADPAFREALVPLLASSPPWRAPYLRRLQAQGESAVADAVLGQMHADGQLDAAEFDAWIESLLRRGDWPQAYARWVGTLPDGALLTPVFNGGFTQRPSGKGFDWRVRPVAGVSIEFIADSGARLDFHGRRIADTGLSQALLLAPGTQQLEVKMRTEGLRAQQGLQWVLECATNRRILGQGQPWRTTHGPIDERIVFQVPADCPGQWLRLRNAARAAPLQTLSGRLWIEQVAATPLDGPG